MKCFKFYFTLRQDNIFSYYYILSGANIWYACESAWIAWTIIKEVFEQFAIFL